MPTPVVHDPRQNQHGWWGTIGFVADQDDSGVISSSMNGNDAEVQHVFVKTSRESHFVAQGTAVELEPLGDTAEAVIKQLQLSGISETVLGLIKQDFLKLDAKPKKFYQIVAVNDSRTTPLARMLNLVTEVCFRNDHWLDSAGSIGVADIRVGRELPSVKKPVSAPAGVK